MVEFFTNTRYSGDEGITISSNNRISFNVEFVRKHNLKEIKFCFITAPEREKKTTRIGFVFSETPDALPGVSPFKLNKHSKADRFAFAPKLFFDKYSINSANVAGTYTPIEKKDPKIGSIYWITLHVT